MQFNIDREDPNFERWGEPTLADMVEKAIRILRKDQNGYMLLVEGRENTVIWILFHKYLGGKMAPKPVVVTLSFVETY